MKGMIDKVGIAREGLMLLARRRQPSRAREPLGRIETPP
jgi:hypothetical protein